MKSTLDILKLDLLLQYRVLGNSKQGGVFQRKITGIWETVTIGSYWECNAMFAEIEKLKRNKKQP